MGWMLEAAGVSGGRPCLAGCAPRAARKVWLWTLRAWRRDTSEDLAPTMAALDRALAQAGQAANWLRPPARPAPPEPAEPPASNPDGAWPR